MRLGRRLLDALRSPRRLVAFLRRVAQVAWRGELGPLLTRVRPRGPTADEYRAWRSLQPAQDASPGMTPVIIALDAGNHASYDGFKATVERSGAHNALVVVRAGRTGWAPLEGGAARSLADWSVDRGASWIWWIATALQLAPGANAAMARGCSVPGARIVYADHEVHDVHGDLAPVFKSAWDRIQLLERPYPAPFLAVRADFSSAIENAGETGIAGQWRFLLDAIENAPASAVVHVPRVVAQLAFNAMGSSDDARDRGTVSPSITRIVESGGVRADTSPSRTPWLRLRVESPCPVSVVIPTRDHPALLERCLRALIAEKFPQDAEVVVVDNGSSDPRVAQLLQRTGLRVTLNVVSMPGPFNFPALCNAGVAAARGRVVVLLNNDTEVGSGWLAELASLAAYDGIGAVGPLLLYPDGMVQSAGVLLGVNRTATSALAGFDADDPVVRAWCTSRRRVSAVLGACLAVSRERYVHAGGMDESFGVSHNELDFCLRLEADGLANVFTPFARVVHEEGGTRGFELTGAERQRLDAEERLFLARWGHVLETADPAHHPALARTGNPFSLASGVADARPRSGWRAAAAR